MNTQVNVRMPEKLLLAAREYADDHGYGSVQEFIRETVRQKLFDEEDWLTAEEAELVRIVAEESEKRGHYGTREELFQALKD